MKSFFMMVFSVLLIFVLAACGSSEQSNSFTFEKNDEFSYETVDTDHSYEWMITNSGTEVGNIQYVENDYLDEQILSNLEGGLHQDEVMTDWHYENTRFVLEHVKSMDVIQRFYFLFPVNDTYSYLLTSTTPTLEKEEIMKLAQSFRYD